MTCSSTLCSTLFCFALLEAIYNVHASVREQGGVHDAHAHPILDDNRSHSNNLLTLYPAMVILHTFADGFECRIPHEEQNPINTVTEH